MTALLRKCFQNGLFSKYLSKEVNDSHMIHTVFIFSENKKSLWIGNVGLSVTEEHLQNYFEKFGEIVSLKILHSSGCAFVNYKSAESAKSAITASTVSISYYYTVILICLWFMLNFIVRFCI